MKPLDIWWVRILIMAGVLMVSFIVLTRVFTGNDSARVIQSIVYGFCAIVMVGLESLRSGGQAVASGLVPTAATPRLSLYGISWGLGAVGAVSCVAYLLGGRFETVPLAIELTSIATVVLFAIGEEVVFRGTIFRALEERFSPIAAIFITSVLFALLHLSNPGSTLISFANVFLAGVALGTCVAVSRTLWMAIGFHVTWNLAIALLFGVVSGNDLPLDLVVLDASGILPSLQWLITGPFGVEDGLSTTVIMIGSLLILKRIKRFDPFVQAARFQRELGGVPTI